MKVHVYCTMGGMQVIPIRSNEPFELDALSQVVLENVPDAVIGVDAKGVIVSYNRKAMQVFGWNREQMIGQKMADRLISEEDRERYLDEVGQNQRFEVDARRADGRRFSVELTLVPVFLKGQFYSYSFIRDLSERKRLDEEDRYATELSGRLHFVLDALPVFISYVGADGRYQFTNAAYSSVFQKTKDELRGRHIREVWGETNWKEMQPRFDQALGGKPIQFEMNAMISDEAKIFQVNYLPDQKYLGTQRAQRKVKGMVILGQDITPLKKVEAYLQQALEGERHARNEMALAHLRIKFLAQASTRLLSSIDYEDTLKVVADLAVPAVADWCAIDLLNEQGKLERLAVKHVNPTKVNLAWELDRRYPVDLKDDVGIAQVVRAGKSEVYNDISDDSLRSIARDEEHYRILRSVGLSSVIIVPLSARGKVLGAVIFALDQKNRAYSDVDVLMTEELGRRAGLAIENARLYREAKEAIQARNEFISICSHELKTPLTSMKLQFQMAARQLKRGDAKAWSRESVERRVVSTNRQLERMMSLIEEMLDVSRIAAGRLEMNLERFDLKSLVLEGLDRFTEQFASQGIQVNVEVGPSSIDTQVQGDRFRLEQVISNLFSNAVKYGEGRPIHVNVAPKEGQVRLSVLDQGIGIAQQSVHRIFDRFERAISAANISGLGLGLYISRQIVNAHHGRIWAESELGRGSEFIVELPRAKEN